MKGSTMVLLRSLLLFAAFVMTLTVSADLPPVTPGQARYLVVLWEQGTPIPGSNGKHLGKIEEPDFAKAGGVLLAARRNQRIIDLPVKAAVQLRKHQSVAYVQRIWMGEEISELYEAPYASNPRPRLQSEDDPLLTWGPKSYTYDGSGNIVKIGQTGAYDNYTYDTAGRLIESTVGGQTEKYEYDSFGNLISKGISGANTQAIPVDGSSNRIQGLTYDAAGNITTRGLQWFQYDAFNVMTNHKERRMLYDADDERIGILLDAEWSRWWFRDFEGRVLREYKGMPAFNTEPWVWEQDYLYAEGKLVAGERILWNAGFTGGNDAWFGGVRHYHLDHLDSVRLATNSSGRSVSQHDYYPFGVTPTKASQEQINWADPHVDSMRYAGHQREFLGNFNSENTDYLDYMHARFYDPNLGRFLSVDPGEDTDPSAPQTWNKYSYARNNPVNATDPTGMYTATVTVIAPKPQVLDDFRSWLWGLSAVQKLDRWNTTWSQWAEKHRQENALKLANWLQPKDRQFATYEQCRAAYNCLDPDEVLPFVGGQGRRTAFRTATRLIGAMRYTPQQQAVIDLAKKAVRRGGVTKEEAMQLIKWAKEYGVPYQNHIGANHWVGGPHIRIGNINHIKVN